MYHMENTGERGMHMCKNFVSRIPQVQTFADRGGCLIVSEVRQAKKCGPALLETVSLLLLGTALIV
jgi:hypothetical protein